MNFDSSMSKVQALSGSTGDELIALKNKAQELGASTAWSASQVSEAMQYMALAGWKANDMLEGTAGFLAIMNTSDEAFNQLADSIDNSTGSAEKMSEVMLDNLGGQITMFILTATVKTTTTKNGTTLTTPTTTREVKSPPDSYVVKQGDTLWLIAKKLTGDGSNYKAIAKKNDITDPNKLSVGQRLVI